MKHPSAVILPQHLTVGRARDSDGDRAARRRAGGAAHAYVVAEVLAAELAPDAELRVSSRTSASSSRVPEAACPSVDPAVAARRRYLALAYLAVFRANSALVPPMTMARW
jgi:hypothetical protein